MGLNKLKVKSEVETNFGQEHSKRDKSEEGEDFRAGIKLGDGSNEFRSIVFDDGTRLVELWVHYKLGVPFLCPNKLDPSVECPSCKFGWSIYNDRKKADPKGDPKSWHTEESRSWLAQQKGCIRGIQRSKEAEDIQKFGFPKVRFLDLSPTNAKIFLGFFEAKEKKKWGDIMDPESGRDLDFKKDAAKAKEKQASVTIERAPVQSSIFSDSDLTQEQIDQLVDKMLQDAIDISKRFEVKSPAEIEEMMEEFKQKLLQKVVVEPENFSDGESPSFAESLKELKESGASDIDAIASQINK